MPRRPLPDLGSIWVEDGPLQRLVKVVDTAFDRVVIQHLTGVGVGCTYRVAAKRFGVRGGFIKPSEKN